MLSLCCCCRYAGRAFESEQEAAAVKGTLIVKGLKSMWRQAAPIVRTTLHGALVRILMHNDVRWAGQGIYSLLIIYSLYCYFFF